MKPFKHILIAIVLLLSLGNFANYQTDEKPDTTPAVAVVVDDLQDFPIATAENQDHYDHPRFGCNQDGGEGFIITGAKIGYSEPVQSDTRAYRTAHKENLRLGHIILMEKRRTDRGRVRMCGAQGSRKVVQGDCGILYQQGDHYRDADHGSTKRSAGVPETVPLVGLSGGHRALAVRRA